MKPLRFDDEAEEELVAAVEWYEERRRGLGGKLLAKVGEVILRVRETPLAHPLALDNAPDVLARRAVVPRFPYAIVFLELTDETRVLALAHDRRRPGYWHHRVSR